MPLLWRLPLLPLLHQLKSLPFRSEGQMKAAMESSSSSTRLQQVYVPLSGDHYEPVACPSADKSTPLFEQKSFQSRLLRLCPSDLWYNKSYSTFCPHPVLIAPTHQQRLKDLNNALALAITDIVSRWWTDSEAQFPQRMPLDPKEEALLQVWRTIPGLAHDYATLRVSLT